MHGYMKLIFWLLLLSCWSPYFGDGNASDVQCLKDLKQSLIDPNGILESSWNFTRVGRGDICKFTGVECWHPDENRVLGLRLGNLGFEGPFPAGLELCSSMLQLDLSGNKLSGPLPEHISDQLPYVTKLNLSNNSFSGEIPAGIANMTYLNTLLLQDNQFEGRIPTLIASRFVDNALWDPMLGQPFSSANFTGNPGLCGAPLDKKCKNRVRLRRINDASSIGAAAGFVVGFVVAFYLPHRFLFCRRLRPYVFRVCG